jgi:hypothetical protein
VNIEYGEGTSITGISNPRCYGVQLTLEVPFTFDNILYPAGAKLTVDKDLNWIQVSGWD